jgi:hypothetical protein
MALRVALASGNWSNPAIWNNGVLPVAGDVVASNGFTVTIDQNITVDTLTNTVQTPVIITPAMTSNTAPSGIVTASGVFGGGFEAWRAFDRVFNNWLSAGPTGWVAYEFTSPKIVQIYQMVPPTNNAPGSVPRNWTFEAWDGTTWVVLDTVTGNSGTATVTRTTTNTTAYIRYRINITLNNGDLAYTGVTELRMYEANDYTINSVAGGGFILNSGYTVNANLTGGAVDLLTYTGSGTSSINGIIRSGSANNTVLFNTVSGTLNITGDIVNNNAGMVVRIANTGTLNIIGNVYNTTASYGNCLNIIANATVNITGNIFTSGVSVFSNQTLIAVSAASTLNIVGNVTHISSNSTSSSCIAITASATIRITGVVTGGDFSSSCNAVSTNAACLLNIVGSIISRPPPNGIGPAVVSTNSSAINLFSGPFICNNYGFVPFQCIRMHLIPNVTSYFEFRDETTNGAVSPGAIAPAARLVSPGGAVDAPIPANVRSGISYASGTLLGTMAVPSPSNVANNVPVDNTVGTAILDPNAIWSVPLTSINTLNSIGRRVKNAATVETTGAQIESILNSL